MKHLKRNQWTPDDLVLLHTYYPDRSVRVDDLATMLFRTPAAVMAKAHSLGIKRGAVDSTEVQLELDLEQAARPMADDYELSPVPVSHDSGDWPSEINTKALVIVSALSVATTIGVLFLVGVL